MHYSREKIRDAQLRLEGKVTLYPQFWSSRPDKSSDDVLRLYDGFSILVRAAYSTRVLVQYASTRVQNRWGEDKTKIVYDTYSTVLQSHWR
jgi:hypothetical protein